LNNSEKAFSQRGSELLEMKEAKKEKNSKKEAKE